MCLVNERRIISVIVIIFVSWKIIFNNQFFYFTKKIKTLPRALDILNCYDRIKGVHAALNAFGEEQSILRV